MSTSDERLLGGHTGRMLVLLSAGLAVVRLGRLALPPLLPAVIEDFSITSFEAGLALSLAALGFALLQFPSGLLSDQLTRKTVLVGSLSVLAVGSLLLSVAPTFAVFVLGVAVIGVGEGLYGAADRGLLSDLFVDRRGVAFGVHTTFSDVGGVLAAGLAAGALAVGAWRAAFVPAVVGAVVFVGLLARWGREPVRVARVSPPVRETARRLVGQRRVLWVGVAYVLFSVASQGVIGFLPLLLRTDQGFSPGLASAVFAGMFAVGIVARPVAGRLSDRGNRPVVGGAGLVLAAAGIATVLTATSSLVVTLGVAVYGVGQKAFPPAMQAYLMDTFPDASMAGDLGATRTVYIGLGSVGPAYVGFVAGHLSYSAAFAGFVAAMLAGGAVTLGLAVTDGGGPS